MKKCIKMSHLFIYFQRDNFLKLLHLMDPIQFKYKL